MIFDASFSSRALLASACCFEAFKDRHGSDMTAPENVTLLGRISMSIDDFDRSEVLAEPCVSRDWL